MRKKSKRKERSTMRAVDPIKRRKSQKIKRKLKNKKMKKLMKRL